MNCQHHTAQEIEREDAPDLLVIAPKPTPYGGRMAEAKVRFQSYRKAGGEEDEFRAWLYYDDRDLYMEWQGRSQKSSYPVAGGVMFCPVPQKGRV